MSVPPDVSMYGTQTTLDAEADLGWDSTGKTPITSMPDIPGTTIKMGPGVFLFDQRFDFHNLEDWALVGDPTGGTTVRIAKGHTHPFLNIRSGSNFCVANFTLDNRSDLSSATGMNILGTDWQIRNIKYKGIRPTQLGPTCTGLNFYDTDWKGTSYIVGFEGDDAADRVSYPDNPILAFSGPESVGVVFIQDSVFKNSGEHGIYAGRCTGDVRIEGCIFSNNQNTQVRISGEGSYVKDSTFVWPANPQYAIPKGEGQTGLTWESGFQGFTGGLVENCDFYCESSNVNSGLLKVDGSHGGLTIRDCRFFVADGNPYPAINVEAPGDSHMITGLPDAPHDVTIENVSIIHEGTTPSRWYDGAIDVAGRNVTLTDLDIMTTQWNGIKLESCTATLTNVLIQSRFGMSLSSTDSTVTGTPGNGPAPRQASKTLPSTTPVDETTPPDQMFSNFLLVKAQPGAAPIEYSFTVDSEVVARHTNVEHPADSGDQYADTPVDNGDGTWTVTGWCGGGGGDSFETNGKVVAWNQKDNPKISLTVNGQPVAIEAGNDAPAEEPTSEPTPDPAPAPEEPTTEPASPLDAYTTRELLQEVLDRMFPQA